jgi:hypothetical protein
MSNVVEVKGRDGFVFRLFVDVMTHLPTMISWRQAPMVIATQSIPPRASRSSSTSYGLATTAPRMASPGPTA